MHARRSQLYSRYRPLYTPYTLKTATLPPHRDLSCSRACSRDSLTALDQSPTPLVVIKLHRHTLFTSQSKPRFLALLPEGPLSEAGGGEDLIISVAKERDKVLLALLDLAKRLFVRLAQPFDHGCDSACGVGAWGAWWGDRYGP